MVQEKMLRTSLYAFLFVAVGAVPHAVGQDGAQRAGWQKRLLDRGPKALLERGAIFYGHPGSMAFHTAFHGGVTTRYLLLKAAPRLPALRNYLQLDDRQLEAISELQPLEMEVAREDHPDALGDANAQADEQIVESGYFGFLSADQLSRVDRVAMYFDGYPALARRSVADRLDLSADTRSAIATILSDNREQVYLPYFRARFAAPLTPDHEYADSVFFGKFLAHLNHEIADALKPPEAARLVEWLGVHPDPGDVVDAIKKKAPMPGGMSALAAWVHQNEVQQTDDEP